MGIVFVLTALLLVGADCLLLSPSKQNKIWNALKVTWSPNILSSNTFADLPRTEHEALEQGFSMLSDCDENGKTLGKRYAKNNDTAVILLYDRMGYIAGIQCGVPVNMSNGYPWAEVQPPFVRDGDLWLLTAYFVPPQQICSTGRTAAQYVSQGTGTHLYIQNGTDPKTDVISIPSTQAAMNATKWTKGRCFATMGVHYWYNLSHDMSCHKSFPVFLLFNGGKLNAFGWALYGDLTSSRYEHPPYSSISMFMQDVPACMEDNMPVSTMHIYFDDSYDFC